MSDIERLYALCVFLLASGVIMRFFSGFMLSPDRTVVTDVEKQDAILVAWMGQSCMRKGMIFLALVLARTVFN